MNAKMKILSEKLRNDRSKKVIFVWDSKRKYRRLANKIVEEIRDYTDSGFEVIGVVGIDGSPSCGVNQTLNMKTLLVKMSEIDIGSLTRERTNQLIKESLMDGKAYFVQELQNGFRKLGMEIEFYAHDLLKEMGGETSGLRIA